MPKKNQNRLLENQAAKFICDLSDTMAETYADGIGINHKEGGNLPRESEILQIIAKLTELVFPGFSERGVESISMLRFTAGEILSVLYTKLVDVLSRAYKYDDGPNSSKKESAFTEQARCVTEKLLGSIPAIREILMKDVQAAFDGDPAAKSLDEIILSYPCIKAITINRFAHILYNEKVPLIPRMMGEYAHRITAIDIHPGATLGSGVFIDHGTGVVIGETATIGNGVKIYQGVTLGALSFPKDAGGKIIKGAKRHPTIEDEVTIYAGATILGDVTIGKGSVIGGNVWLTHSIPAGTKITIAAPDLRIKES